MEGQEPVGVQRSAHSQDAFTRFVNGRPFFGGLWLTLGGAWILLTMKASIKVVVHVGMQGVAGYLLPTLMVLLGLLILFSPAQRLFYSITGVLVSMGTWVTSNMGGFMVGLLLGVVGSILTFGWLPDQEPRVSRRERRRTAQGAPQDGPATGTGQAGADTRTAQNVTATGAPRTAP
ncbi:hypothetical protein M2164_002241 [Streptomyces sp. SAI-208]|jgi:hypothetical protein|uniref:DUF6114 domain-containing protein n=1 Tax=unclassified Streptomyces TaxID=2593676 RepID=UPI00247318E1|nr:MULTISPECIES: DUF6114 domain-containing protein [unclassified Streptomyces]MDH6567075.1 hypothetical protein [Streptomyces sp. SAI-117]MDH6587990.1 hypothetical protein [Streptomyces sp. SAI-133]MDH6606606.1 hypothetical protein [Streptomyces sp. SAI-208]